MKSTIRDVAAKAKVSITTVSFILNGKEDLFSEQTRKLVLDAVKELNYVPNRRAQNLSTKRSNLIALLVPDLTNPYYTTLAQTALTHVAKVGLDLALISLPNSESEWDRISRLLLDQSFDGALIVSSRFDQILPKIESNVSFKYVLLDEPVDINEVVLVTGDSEYGGQIACEHFIENGHTKLACITGPENTPNSTRRLKGFLETAQNNGIDPESILVELGDYSFEGGYNAAKKISKEDVTALFCFNDLMALGALSAFNELGVSVPEQISIIGYDSLEMCKYLNPRLTSVDQHVDEIGNIATEQLLNLIDGKPIEKTKTLVLPSLIKGDTVLNRKKEK